MIRNLEDFASIASDWFWETDGDQRFTYFSNKMEEVTGVRMADLIGQTRLEISPDRAREPEWQAHLDDLVNHRPFRNFEYKMQRNLVEGDLWIRISGEPVFDEDGVFQGYRGVGHDVTPEKESMELLEASNKALSERNRELLEARRAIERIASSDPLTDLLNRRAFESDIATALENQTDPVVLMHVDLDFFKMINDMMGHLVGDLVLVETAKRMAAVIVDHGRTYRVGGDEFTVVLTGQDRFERASRLGENLIAALSEPLTIENRHCQLGASIGLAVSRPPHVSAQELIANADVALYESKRRGRGTLHRVTPKLLSRIEEKRSLAADIRNAIERRESIPFFQPQIDLQTDTIIGAEALARWQHPVHGLLTPNRFLDIAAELGLTADIDGLMMETALAAAGRLADGGLPIGAVSVNISESRLIEPRLITDIERLWTDKRVRLSLELLETIYFDPNSPDDPRAAVLEKLRAAGVRLEIDDFGSARASIASLLSIWPDRIKIDKALVQAILKDPSKRAMIQAILDMTRSLGIDTIAEGVEDEQDLQALRDLGCHHIQGYVVARPMPEAALVKFMSSRANGTGGTFASSQMSQRRA